MKDNYEKTRKITVNIPVSLIDPLMEQSGQGPTELLTELLKKEKNRRAWQALSELRGKVNFGASYEEVMKTIRDKEDRDLNKFLIVPPDSK